MVVKVFSAAGEPDLITPLQEEVAAKLNTTDAPAATRNTPLTGLNLSVVDPVSDTDFLLAAIGKLQGQLNAVPRKFPVNFWSNQYASAAATNTVFATGTTFYSFFVAPRPITFTKIGAAFNNNEAGRQLRVRYYDFVTRTAVTPVYQFAADVLSPVPELTLPAAVTLPAGVYLVGYHNTGTTASTQQMRSLPSASCLQMPTALQVPLGMTGLTNTSDFASSLPATIPIGAVEYAGGQAIINFFVSA